ncbi:MAG: GTP-binding protein [Candidatus Hodarchaeales archaeon]
MPKFRVDEAVEMMKDRIHVRNLGIIAHIDHGKTTLTDSLLAESGLLAEKVAGEARATDTREDEQERGITIKTTGISLVHAIGDQTYLINLQDTPGHVDFSGEVTSALRVVDGALVVVDAVEGVMVQTETVTRQALLEKVRPVLYINKVDRLITEMRMSPENAYEKFKEIIRDFNVLIETYAPPEFKKKWRVDPRQGTVAFGSAVHRFGLTIPALAEIWSKKTGKDEKELVQSLWMKNNFVPGVLKPTYAIYEATETENIDFLHKVTKQIGVKLDEDEWRLPPKRVAKAILEKWQPVEKAILDMVCRFCPNPIDAQKYRIGTIWEGQSDSEIGKAMVDCDENGPVMIVLSKMIPMRAKRIVAMGRVFSGTIKSGTKVACLLPGYAKGGRERRFVTNIQNVSILMGKDTEQAGEVPAGNIVALYGLRGAVASSTVTSSDDVEGFKSLAYAVEPVVTVAIEAKNPRELPRLAEGMKLIELVDPSLKAHINEETGEYLLSGTGELHLEIAVKDLQDMQKMEVMQSQPIVVFRESVDAVSMTQALAKSPNKHNRLWVTAEPAGSETVELLETGQITAYTDSKEMARILRDSGWDAQEARKVWGFGPEENGPNVIVDATKGVQYLREIKDYIIQGFRWAAGEGPLCGEPMHSVKYKLHDCKLHEDPAHRGVAQVMPVARRVCFGASLLASPILLEPYYRIQIQVPEDHLGAVYKVITRRRGRITDTSRREGTPLNVVTGELPVAESFGMTAELRSETSGFAFAQMVFDHWEKVPGDPMKTASEGGGLSREFVEKTRERKGMHSNAPPNADQYYDKL